MLFKRFSPNKKKNNNKVGSDMGSVLDAKIVNKRCIIMVTSVYFLTVREPFY